MAIAPTETLVTLFPLPSEADTLRLANHLDPAKQHAAWQSVMQPDSRGYADRLLKNSDSYCKVAGKGKDSITVSNNLDLIGEKLEDGGLCTLVSIKIIFVLLKDGALDQCVALSLYQLEETSWCLASYIDLQEYDEEAAGRQLGTPTMFDAVNSASSDMNRFARQMNTKPISHLRKHSGKSVFII